MALVATEEKLTVQLFYLLKARKRKCILSCAHVCNDPKYTNIKIPFEYRIASCCIVSFPVFESTCSCSNKTGATLVYIHVCTCGIFHGHIPFGHVHIQSIE